MPRTKAAFPVMLPLAGFLVLAALAAYSNSFSGPFVFDDLPAIVDNPTIRHLWPPGGALSPPPGGATVSGRPILNISFALNHAISGESVWSYHAFNLLVHVGAGLTLFGILRRVLADRPVILPFGIALVWMLHPLQTESVTYIVQRAESLMGLFYLLTLYCFVRYAEGDQAGRNLWGLLCVGACLVGMATKEVMVSAPLIVVLYDRTFVSGTFSGAWKRHRRLYLGLGFTWLVLVLDVLSTPGRGGTAGFQTGLPWFLYLLAQFPAIFHYLRLAAWPHPLVFDYGTTLAWAPAISIPEALVVVLLLLGTILALFRAPRLGFAGAAFFALLAPSSSVLPVITEVAAEHRMYLALAPVLTLVACVGHDLTRRFFAGRFPAWACGAVLAGVAVALGCLTFSRNAVYRSELTLWEDTVAKLPANERAQNALGRAFFLAGRVPEAVACYQTALRLEPNYPEARNNLGAAFFGMGRVQEAIAEYQIALKLRPGSPEAERNMGNALVEANRLPEAAVFLSAAAKAFPDDLDVRKGLAGVLCQLGRFSEGIPLYREALRADPRDSKTHANLGMALASSGRLSEGIVELDRAVRLKPDDAAAQSNLGVALLASGRLQEAIGRYEAALRLLPQSGDLHYNYGAALQQAGRSEEANAQWAEAARLGVRR